MKKLFILLTIISCNKVKMKVGECIQRPDEVFVWKIVNIQEDNLILVNQTTQKESAVTESKNQTWSKVNCL